MPSTEFTKVYGDVPGETVTGVTPSVYVIDQGEDPDKVITTSGIGSPKHIVPPPATVAVGKALMSTVT